MITLDTNLTLYPGLYHYLPLLKNINNKAYSSIEQYTDAKAAKGATEAQNPQQAEKTNNKNIPNDYSSLIEMLRLNIPENKMAILKLIPQSELLQFVSLLNKDQLLNGLKLFTKEKLLNFIANLPKEQLLKMLGRMYISPEHILENFSIKDLTRFLSSKKIEKSNMIKIFESLSSVELAQIAEAATGVSQGNKSQVELLKFINGLSSTQITDGIKGLEFKKMRSIVSEMLKQDPTLYTEFTQEAFFRQTAEFAKTSIIEGMGVLDSEDLIKYLGQLPNNMLALVATQIDTSLFAQILVNDYQKLLSSISA